MAPVTGITPFATDRSTDGTIGVSAEDARFAVNSVWAQSAPNRVYDGVVPSGTDPATGTPAGLIVTATTPASNQLQVSAGNFVVQSDAEQTAWTGGFEGTSLITVPPADTTNSRTDLAVAWVEPGKDSMVDVFPGPTDGSGDRPSSLPARCTVLASWTTPAGSSTTISSVSGERRFAVAVGGNRLVIDGVGRDDPASPGQMRSSLSTADKTFSVDLFTGSGWVPVASERISWTPAMSSKLDGPVNLGASGYATGFYQLFIGGLCYLWANIVFGGTGRNAGRGDLQIALPPGIRVATPQRILASLYGTPYAWVGEGYFDANQQILSPVFPNAKDDCRVSVARSADETAAAYTGIPYEAGYEYTWDHASLILSGSFMLAQ
jgi:hypothetical protein